MSMRYKASAYLSEKLAEITRRDSAKMTYALWGLFTIILTVILLLMVKAAAALYGIELPVLTVYISFSILRYFLGGFHLQNTRLCLVSTMLLISLSSIIAYLTNIGVYMIIACYAIGYAAIYTIGVKDCKQKRFKKERKARYQKIGLGILSVLFLSNLWLYQHNRIILSNAIMLGAVLEYINLVLSSLIGEK